MQLRKIILFLGIQFLQVLANAEDFGRLRVGGLLGAGGSAATLNGITRTEGPLGINLFIDYSFNSQFTLGAEHSRSLKSGTAAVGFTGLTGKFYLWTPSPQYMENPDDVPKENYLIQKNITPYFGFSTGFAQASIQSRSNTESPVLTTNLYSAFKLGLEYPIVQRWGARSELSYAISLGGEGSVIGYHVLIGAFYFL